MASQVLSKAELERCSALREQLDQNLPRRMRLWVKDPKQESTNSSSSSSSSEDFSIEVTAVTPVEVVREVVRAKATAMMIFDEELDGALQLVYDGAVLVDGAVMGDYVDEKRARRFPAPYAGVLWIGQHEVRTHCTGWGTAGDMAATPAS